MSVAEKMLTPPVRQQVVTEATKVLNAEVSDKRGLTGVAVKGAFKMVRGVKPGFVPQAIDDLMDDFVPKLLPFWETWKADPGGKTCSQHFVANAGTVADALLSITDERAKHSTSRVLVKAYKKLRPMGKDHVMASMPRVSGLIEQFTKDE